MFKLIKKSTYEDLIRKNNELESELLFFELKDKEDENCRIKYQDGIGNFLNNEYINLIRQMIDVKKCEEVIIKITVQYANMYCQNKHLTNTCMWYGLIVIDGNNDEIMKVTILTDKDNGIYSEYASKRRNRNLLITNYIGQYVKYCLESDKVILTSLRKISSIEDIKVKKGLFKSEIESLEI